MRQIIHLPTAAGKTVIFASLIAQAIQQDPTIRVLILAFSCDLLSQARDKIHMINSSLDVGIVDASHKEFDRQIVVSSIQSARIPGNLERLQSQGFTICIADECHHFASDTARLVLRELGFDAECTAQGRLLVGFSATAARNDDRGLGEVFERIVYSKSISELIDGGYLVRPSGVKAMTDLDLGKVLLDQSGDYSAASLSDVMDTPEMLDLVVRSFEEKGMGRKRTIAFCTSIAHSEHLAACFRRSGVNACAIHSNLPNNERKAILKRFRDGELEVLTNPLLLTEGFDCPEIDCVIVSRPTKSVGLYTQMVGRGLRLFPGKDDCLIIDFCDKAHSLCSVAILTGDVDQEKIEIVREKQIEETIGKLPPTLNQKLKSALMEFDPIGKSFTWAKEFDGSYSMKGAGEIFLKIIPAENSKYTVIVEGISGSQTLSDGLDFEWAFSTAEDFARENKSRFTISDLNASWRDLPISEKQMAVFRSSGFRSGIGDLTRGQASLIIGSGVLKKRTGKNRKNW